MNHVNARVTVTVEVTVTVGTWGAKTSLAELREQACREAEQALRGKLSGSDFHVGKSVRMGAVVVEIGV